jgi:hypothetical protein
MPGVNWAVMLVPYMWFMPATSRSKPALPPKLLGDHAPFSTVSCLAPSINCWTAGLKLAAVAGAGVGAGAGGGEAGEAAPHAVPKSTIVAAATPKLPNRETMTEHLLTELIERKS